MNARPSIDDSLYSLTIQMVDAEFDRFEMNTDCEMVLREADPANFYHDALNDEE
jgi:hypothetical protein